MSVVSAFLRALRLDAFFAWARQYPLAYCLLAAILAATVLLHRLAFYVIGAARNT